MFLLIVDRLGIVVFGSRPEGPEKVDLTYKGGECLSKFVPPAVGAGAGGGVRREL